MSTQDIRFNDGAAYERFMGRWSQPVGEQFLDWLAVEPGLAWLDVGCGNGAFTDILVRRMSPRAVAGLDPSPAQLSFARERFAAGVAEFHQGDAMAMPFHTAAFDVAVMPLVLFFVPVPAKGVAEMARVVRPGGHVAAYAWDMDGGGFPYASLMSELKALAVAVPEPPSPQASRLDAMTALWTGAGLGNVETTTITVQRTFDSFDHYWTTVLESPSAGVSLKAMPQEAHEALQRVMRGKLPADADGRIMLSGRANAVKGRVKPLSA